MSLGHTDVAVSGQEIVGTALWITPGIGQMTGTLPHANELASIVSTPDRVQEFIEQFQVARKGSNPTQVPISPPLA